MTATDTATATEWWICAACERQATAPPGALPEGWQARYDPDSEMTVRACSPPCLAWLTDVPVPAGPPPGNGAP
jgi:hypothetical protein